MRAILYTGYGKSDALKLNEIDKPVPGDNEVLIKVYAVSINDWDWELLQGTPFINRLLNGLLKPRRHNILGSDIAGKIETVGKNVKRFQPGDEVFGDLTGHWGGFAEYVCAHQNALALKPSDMSFGEAAAIPQAAMLAVQGLRDKGQIQSGQKLLINGAGGGVGTFGIQIAKLFDVEVTGVDRTEKLDMMRSMGFDHVVDYTREDFTQNEQCFDLILDIKMSRSIFDYMRVLKPNGKYVPVGGSMIRLFQAFIIRPFISMFGKKKILIVALKPNKDLPYMIKLFKAGKVIPVIDRSFKFSDTPEAMRYFSEGKHKGKIIITLQHDNRT